MPHAPRKPYRTKKADSHTRLFRGQEEVGKDATGKDDFLIVPTCKRLCTLVSNVARALDMNCTQAAWFSLVFVLDQNIKITTKYSPLQLQRIAEAGFDCSAKTKKKFRTGPKARRRVNSLSRLLGLRSVAATFRFAITYTHDHMEDALVRGGLLKIQQDPQRAFAEFKATQAIQADNLDDPDRQEIVEALASGRDLAKEFPDNFPGWTHEDIRDTFIDILKEQAAHVVIGAADKAQHEAWEEEHGTAVIRRDLQDLSDEVYWLSIIRRVPDSTWLEDMNRGIRLLREKVRRITSPEENGSLPR